MATLGSLAVGSIVKLNVDGVATNFIVVHQGLPSSVYDSSCNGTWLMAVKCPNYQDYWSTSNNSYASSIPHSWFNTTYLASFDIDIQKAIKSVKIPYTNGAGNVGSVATGANGLSAKIFLPSLAELDLTNTGANVEGATLAYFEGAANSKRVAGAGSYTAINYFTRTPSNANNTNAYAISTTGSASSINIVSKNKRYFRPTLIMPYNLTVDDSGMVIAVKKSIGQVNIGGVMRELTGKGYVNKKGILYPLTLSSKVNIGGVLKSLLIGEEVKTSRLPDGYTEVEYIQSSGGQYINTGFKPDYNTRVVMDVSGLANQGLQFPLGAKDQDSSTAANQFGMFRNSATTIRCDYFGTNKTVTVSDTTVRTTIDFNKNVCTMWGVTATMTAVSSGAVSYTMYLFAQNTANVIVSSAYAIMRMYSCQIYDNGTLVRDFVPCTNSSGAAGLYDLVNNTFYGNSGSGSFTAGAAV